MHEHVLAAIARLNESKSLGGVERTRPAKAAESAVAGVSRI
jgi:hypothetical protein